MAENTLATFLSDCGTLFESAIGWLGTALDTVMDNPALFVLVVGIPVCGFGIGILKRLLSL